jgi:hypothetical protein
MLKMFGFVWYTWFNKDVFPSVGVLVHASSGVCPFPNKHTQICFFSGKSTKLFDFSPFFHHRSCIIEVVSYYQGILTDRSRQFQRPTRVPPAPPSLPLSRRLWNQKEPVPKEGAVAAVFRTCLCSLVLSRKIPLLALAFSHGQCV